MTTGTEQMTEPYVGMKITGIDARGVRGPAEIVEMDDCYMSCRVRFDFSHQTNSGNVWQAGELWRFSRDGHGVNGLRVEFTPYEAKARLESEIESLKRERDAALRECAKWARESGLAKGALAASEIAGWAAQAESALVAENKLRRATEDLDAVRQEFASSNGKCRRLPRCVNAGTLGIALGLVVGIILRAKVAK